LMGYPIQNNQALFAYKRGIKLLSDSSFNLGM